MSQASASRITQLVGAIRIYLSQHADAADDEYGIATWWLPSMGLQADRDEVAKALGRMRYFVLFDKRGISMRKGSTAAAFLNGLTVVANRTEWTDPEFLDGENVCLFDGTVEGLVAALRRLEGDLCLAGRVAAGGRALYDGRMACGVIARRIVDILQGRDS